MRTWPDTVILDLTRNHRSTAHIVEVANTLLEAGATGIEPAKDDGDVPMVRRYDTDDEEASHVASWLSATHRAQSPWRSMAVLARTNAQLETVGAHLEAASIPYRRGGAEYAPASDLMGSDRRLSDDDENAVTLSTIHRAKGLEFRHVATIGWAEGLLPHYSATSDDEVAEERRLAYVALTRAEETLLITWSRGRNDPRYPDRVASRFLAPVEAAIAAITRRNAPLSGDARRARLAAIRAELASSPALAWPDDGRHDAR